jgi:hypothetical protein
MIKYKFIFSGLLVFSFFSANMVAHGQSVGRPDQYIAFAFDGSKSLNMWQATRAFANDQAAKGKPLKFTYFINAAYYLSNASKNNYIAPGYAAGQGAGKSAIGFGELATDVGSRFDQTNLAYQENNEIANHASGHFDGSTWTLDQWMSEFTQFYNILANVFENNKLPKSALFPNGWSFDLRKITGFRAPQLGHNAAMFEVLPQFGIGYDTSLTSSEEYWPQLNSKNIWNFPLALIPIAGTAKHTLSMDYNFFYSQSGAKEDAAHSVQYEQQMYDSYMAYFHHNYFGNRAPINIGHHFAQWNAGAYWRAMQRFADSVCGTPEVKCVTYRDLVTYLNSLDSVTLAANRAGAFVKKITSGMIRTKVDFFEIDAFLMLLSNGTFDIRLSGRDVNTLSVNNNLKTKMFLAGSEILAQNRSVRYVRSVTPAGCTAAIDVKVFLGPSEIQSVRYNLLNSGLSTESLVKAEDPALIADPAEAHDE